MPSVIIFDHVSLPVADQVKEFKISIDPAPYRSRGDVKIYDDQTAQTESQVQTLASANPLKHLKVSGESTVEMTQQEKDDVDAAELAALILSQKAGAKSLQGQLDSMSRLTRVIVKLLVDELNALRTRDRDRSQDVANATNLADLKTRWAARSALNDRTYTQTKTAINDLVDGE